MKSSKIKVIFFDAAGTLIEPFPSVGHTYSEIAARYGFKLSPQAINLRFRKVWKKRGGLRTLLPASGLSLNKTEKLWWERFVKEVMEPFKMGPIFNVFFNDLYKAFENRDRWRVFPDVRKTLSSLKNSGFRLGVISNWDSRLIPLLKGLDLNKFCDKIMVSSRMGAAKPDPTIFKMAARVFRCDPAECLHVGNDREEDYEGALKAGFSAILLDRKGKKGPGQIKTLNELCRLKVN